jgi:hypothetical protein
MEKGGIERALAGFIQSIESPALKSVAEHWRDICKPECPPAWADIRPAQIKKHLPIVWSYEYLPDEDDFVGRLAGYGITGVSDKPFKGTRLSQLRPNDKYPRSLIRAKRVLQEPALYRGQGLVYKSAESFGFGERIVMPIFGGASHRSGIFGATQYKTISEWESEGKVEAENWYTLAGIFERA